MSEPAKVSLIVVAAGRGSAPRRRRAQAIPPCAGRPLLCHTLEALAAAHDFCATTVVIHADDRGRYEQAVASLSAGLRAARWGRRRSAGRRGRRACWRVWKRRRRKASTPELVLIHDGARAFPSTPLVRRAIAAAARYGAAAPGTRLNDTIKEVDEDGRVVATPSRAPLRAVQTPQGFHFDLILDAHRQAARAGIEGLTDDAAVAEWAGRRAHIFEGEPDNVKITTMDDFLRAEARLFNRGRRHSRRPGLRRSRFRRRAITSGSAA